MYYKYLNLQLLVLLCFEKQVLVYFALQLSQAIDNRSYNTFVI